MGKSSTESAPTPDPQIGTAAIMQAQTGQNMLQFMQQAYAQQAPYQLQEMQDSNEVLQQDLATQKQQSDFAGQQMQRYETEFEPLQDKYVQQAENWDSTARENQVADQAAATVKTQGALAQQQSQRQMAAMGVNPNSGKFQGTSRAATLSTDLAAAGASNTARDQVRQQGLALEGSAINVGNGMQASGAQATGLGISAGSSGVQAGATGLSSFINGTSLMSSGYQGAMSGYGGEASGLTGLYNAQAGAWEQQQQQNNSMMSGIGSVIGTGLGIASMM